MSDVQKSSPREPCSFAEPKDSGIAEKIAAGREAKALRAAMQGGRGEGGGGGGAARERRVGLGVFGALGAGARARAHAPKKKTTHN